MRNLSRAIFANQALVVNGAVVTGPTINPTGVWDAGALQVIYTPGTAGNVLTLSVTYATNEFLTLLPPLVAPSIALTASCWVNLGPPPGSYIFRVQAQSTGTAGPNDALTLNWTARGAS